MNREKLIHHIIEVLNESPVHRLGESLENFLERYKEWYKFRKIPALGKYRQSISNESEKN